MFNLKETPWAGYRTTLEDAQRLEAACIARAAALAAGTVHDNDPRGTKAEAGEVLPRMYSRKDGVGVVTVRGPLINTENEITAWLGIATYPAIREAFVFAATDDKASRVLLDIESGGGQVSGVNDTAKLIAEVNKLKPVTAYTDGMAASAAYWLAASAGEIFSSETALLGSIGVITTHMDYSEALKKDGIKATVLRAGENKALGHPAEPLSDKARTQIEAQLHTVYDIFTASIADARGLPLASADSWANGNEFLGADAHAIGLSDGVSSADKVFAQLVDGVDKPRGANHNQSQNNKRPNLKPTQKAVLDTATLAAIAATAGIEAPAAPAAEVPAAPAAPAAEAPTTPVAPAPAPEAAPAGDVPAAAAEGSPVVEAAAAKDSSELVTYLTAQVKEQGEQLLANAVEIKALKDAAADRDASHKALCDIAANSINKMSVALGGTEANLTALSAVELVAKHSAVAGDFLKVFSVTGGVASTAAAAPASGNVVSFQHRARVNAVGLNRK